MGYKKKETDHYKKNIGVYLLIILMAVASCGVIILATGENGILGKEYKEDRKQNTVVSEDVNHREKVDQIKREQNTLKENSNLSVGVTKEDEKKPVMSENTVKEQDNKELTTKPSPKEEQIKKEVAERIKTMSIDDKISQMFFVSPEELTNYYNVTVAGANTKKAIQRYHVGGVIYFSSHIKDQEQITKMLQNTQKYAREDKGIPMFLGVDEEGGQVTRVARNPKFHVKKFPYLSRVTTQKQAYYIGNTIGTYLKKLGFNMDFAPDADVLTNTKNQVVKYRSFGSNPTNVATLAAAYTKGLHKANLYATYKHFPGHGATTSDTHKGFAVVNRSLEELKKNEFVPFYDGIENSIDFIMVGHLSVPALTKSKIPATLSKKVVTDLLREEDRKSVV